MEEQDEDNALYFDAYDTLVIRLLSLFSTIYKFVKHDVRIGMSNVEKEITEMEKLLTDQPCLPIGDVIVVINLQTMANETPFWKMFAHGVPWVCFHENKNWPWLMTALPLVLVTPEQRTYCLTKMAKVWYRENELEFDINLLALRNFLYSLNVTNVIQLNISLVYVVASAIQHSHFPPNFIKTWLSYFRGQNIPIDINVITRALVMLKTSNSVGLINAVLFKQRIIDSSLSNGCALVDLDKNAFLQVFWSLLNKFLDFDEDEEVILEEHLPAFLAFSSEVLNLPGPVDMKTMLEQMLDSELRIRIWFVIQLYDHTFLPFFKYLFQHHGDLLPVSLFSDRLINLQIWQKLVMLFCSNTIFFIVNHFWQDPDVESKSLYEMEDRIVEQIAQTSDYNKDVIRMIDFFRIQTYFDVLLWFGHVHFLEWLQLEIEKQNPNPAVVQWKLDNEVKLREWPRQQLLRREIVTFQEQLAPVVFEMDVPREISGIGATMGQWMLLEAQKMQQDLWNSEDQIPPPFPFPLFRNGGRSGRNRNGTRTNNNQEQLQLERAQQLQEQEDRAEYLQLLQVNRQLREQQQQQQQQIVTNNNNNPQL